jgi:pimeloyl-ACP methyl ester carboxylesterase
MEKINDKIDMEEAAGRAEPKSALRREFLKAGSALAGVLSVGLGVGNAGAVVSPNAKDPGSAGPFDPAREAKRIAFDRVGKGEKVLLISGFPQTRLSWRKVVPLLSQHYECIAADLPSFGDSAILPVPATTENVARVFHEFVADQGGPLHVVAHDFGAWVAYSWALLFPEDFKSLTLIEAGIPGVTLKNDIELSDFKRKWNFIFMMVPDLPAELTRGKEDVYVGWWYKNKVHTPGAVPPRDVNAYVKAFSRPGRMDAAFDYCRNIVVDMEFNGSHFKEKLGLRLLAVGGQYSIPAMGDSLQPYFRDITSVVIPDAGHFVPEEQPEQLTKALITHLSKTA